MAEVAASVALAEAGAPAPAAAPSSKGISFADGESGADPADAILDEVLAGGDAAAEGGDAADPASPAAGDPAKPADKPAEKPPADAPPTESLEAARLRKGFAKLGEERQKLLELQGAARTERANAQQFAAKAEAHDKLVARLRDDPAGVIAELGDELVNKTLQGFIDREKSPAEREVAKLRAETERDRKDREQREMEATAKAWRDGITAQVRGDERFDLVNTMGLHGQVIDVITSYYEKHSERDDKGNVVVPAILAWDQAAQAVEDHHAGLLDKSKRYGKRAPAAAEPPKKDTPPAKTPPAQVKSRATTSLSSVPVSEAPVREDDFSLDPDERERQVLASLNFG